MKTWFDTESILLPLSLVADQHEVDGNKLFWAGKGTGKSNEDDNSYGLGFYVSKEYLSNVR